MSLKMRKLEEELECLSKKEGGRLFGIAPVSRFDGAPKGHHPLDFLPEAQNVVVIGIPIPNRVVNYQNLFQNSDTIKGNFRKIYLQNYFYKVCGYDVINQRLEQTILTLTLFLEDQGIPTINLSPTYGSQHKDIQSQVPESMGIFSMRHAAVRAGLGEFGFNNIVVTPQYGPRVRFNALITAADLEPIGLQEEKLCRGKKCMACINGCGTGALKVPDELSIIPSKEEVTDTLTYKEMYRRKKFNLESFPWYDPISRTDKTICRENRIEAFCYGKCLRVCPVGSKL